MIDRDEVEQPLGRVGVRRAAEAQTAEVRERALTRAVVHEPARVRVRARARVRVRARMRVRARDKGLAPAARRQQQHIVQLPPDRAARLRVEVRVRVRDRVRVRARVRVIT